ncbi:M13 family metallopeptidase [Actinomyces procaprae]|uniref:M13 family metallopeptidase n=1 Tax=Actinomyces procaprae TaxID=2560010 RepID=UPI0010A2A27F|nr:M13-type metalloendopeptidase [Actinomyces procaprae]
MTDPTDSTLRSSTRAGSAEADSGSVLAGVYESAAADASVRPQDDLFRNVNGTWLATTTIPADRPATGSFLVLRDAAEAACREILEELAAAPRTGLPATSAEKLGALYAAFLDEEHVEALGAAPLHPELVPVLAAADKHALAHALGAHLAAGFTGAVDIDVEVDLNDPERYTTWMAQSGLGLPDESYYREEDRAELRAAYVSHLARMLDLAGLPGRLGAAAEALADRVMAVETALARGHWDRVACRDIEKINNPTAWEDLVASAPAFPWEAWREGVNAAVAAAGAHPGALLEETIVEQPDYLQHLAQVWQETPLEDLRAWAAWHLVHGRATLLSSDFVEENFDFYSHTLQGVDELRARWKRGVGLIEGTLGEALGELYVARHFPPAHKARMEQLVARLIEAYRQSISALGWMSPATRERALEKLSLFTPKIGYPSKWRDYAAVTVTPGDVVGSVRSVEAFELARAVRKLGGPVDRDEWHMTPQTVNAYYNPTMNEIVFPAAILQPPFFDPQADDAVNYAGIGAVIGHEIGHGFDDQGSTFDGHGKVTDWWTQADREAFEARTHALIAQYDAYRPAALVARAQAEGKDGDTVPHVNGELTIGENIGDLGGLGIALKAYTLALADAGIESVQQAPLIDGLTGLERFFYSWARIWRNKSRDDYAELLLTIDPHSPAEFRCNGIVRNVDAFYEAFNVTAADALWLAPEERVTIW